MAILVPAMLPPITKYASGLYYGPLGTLGTGTLTDQQVRAVPIDVHKATLFDRIGLEVTGAGAIASTIRLGIYTDNNGVPGSLFLDAGTIAGDSATYQELTISTLLGPGRWWLVELHLTASTVATVRAITTAANHNTGRTTATNANSALVHSGVSAFPATFTVAGGAVGPFIELRAA